MLLMPGNHAGWFVHHWNALCPGLFAHLWSPPRPIKVYPYLDYALDNGRYATFQTGRLWSAREFRRWLAQIKHLPKLPLFLVVPDVPHNARATLEEWQVWEPELRSLGVPLAFAVQNGIQPEQVPQGADWLFVGGTDDWRYPRLCEWTRMGKPVHVGRVNSLKRLVQCEQAGVSSVDGNGWFTGGDYRALLPYIQARRERLGRLPQMGGAGGEGKGAEAEGNRNNQLVLPHPNLVFVKSSHQQQIPNNITRDHLLLAIENWSMWVDDQGRRQTRSQRYGVRYQKRLYPPKLLVSVANIYANGERLPVCGFSGGKTCNRFLERRGFEIVQVQSLEIKGLSPAKG